MDKILSVDKTKRNHFKSIYPPNHEQGQVDDVDIVTLLQSAALLDTSLDRTEKIPPKQRNTVTPPPPPEEVGGDGFVLTDDESSPRSIRAKSTRPMQGRSKSKSKSMANLLSEVERQKKSFSLLTMVPD
eukprot:scaffold2467_cov142-Skeletonema_dohrnii-CCMP3373.AAC.1